MTERQIHGRDHLLNETQNLVRQLPNKSWEMELDDGTKVPLPERQGKELYIVLKATERLTKKDAHFDFSYRWPKTLDEYIGTRTDCFVLVARALCDYPLETVASPEFSAYVEFARKSKYHEYTSAHAVETELMPLLEPGKFAVGQTLLDDGTFVSHAYLLIRGKEGLYILHKSNVAGPVMLQKFSEEILEGIKIKYGRRMAHILFEDVVNNPDLEEYYKHPPLRIHTE